LLSFVIAGEFQFVIVPRKIPARTGPVRWSDRMPGRLNPMPVADSAHGIWTQPFHASACAGVSGASDAPKSTERAEI
jgi:hypothetical protein